MKILVCFGLVLCLVFPLYNVQGRGLFQVEGIDGVYLALSDNSGQRYEFQETKPSLVQISGADGVILVFEKDELEVVVRRLNCDLFKTETVEGIKICYGYTPMYSGKSINIDNKKSNVQLAMLENKIIAGFPLILSGF